MFNEEIIRRKLEPYGFLSIKSMPHGEYHVYVVYLLPLPFIVQNIVTITLGAQRFKISSGIIFDSRDVSEKINCEAEKIMHRVAEKTDVTLRKGAEIYWIEIESDHLTNFDEAINKIVGAIIELNDLFSRNDHVRDECLSKKYSAFSTLT